MSIIEFSKATTSGTNGETSFPYSRIYGVVVRLGPVIAPILVLVRDGEVTGFGDRDQRQAQVRFAHRYLPLEPGQVGIGGPFVKDAQLVLTRRHIGNFESAGRVRRVEIRRSQHNDYGGHGRVDVTEH